MRSQVNTVTLMTSRAEVAAGAVMAGAFRSHFTTQIAREATYRPAGG